MKPSTHQIAIDADSVYSQAFLIETFRIAKTTIGRWHKAGLKQLPLGTNQAWYLGAEILRFFGSLNETEATDIESGKPDAAIRGQRQ